MQHDQLRAFVAVVEEGSFSRAAKRLYLSQPAISQKVAQLEKELDAVLMIRGRPKMRLTAAGELLYQEVRQVESRLSQIPFQIRALAKSQGGHLRLACSDTVGAYFLPPILAQVREKLPDVLMTVRISVTGQIVQEVLDEETDFGFILLPESDPRLEVLPVLEYRDVLVVPEGHSLEGTTEVAPSRLIGERLMLPGQNTKTRKLIESAFRREHSELPAVQEVGNVSVLKEFARIGLGLGICPDYAIRPRDTLTIRPLRGDFKRCIGLCWRKDRYLSGADQAFLDVLQNSLNHRILSA
jgi:DNA-binding transcriptional LysR family regulator